MHIAIQLAIYWAFAFLTLCAALALLAIFCALIENDLELLTPGKEAIIAAIASFIEAAAAWLLVLFISEPYRWMGMRALIVPALIVAVIYKIAHLEDWSRYESLLLLLFQMAVGCFAASLILGHFLTAMIILIGVVAVLAIIASFARSL
jgi:hypothetical protein